MEKSAKQRPDRAHQSRRRIAAATGIQSKIESGDLPANLDAAWRMQGALPETVDAGNLEILNSGLHSLFTDLRQARFYFQNGEGNGRGGAVTALGALWRFITLFEAPRAEMLHMPILDLQQALAALEYNNVSPMLKPVRRPGRPKSSDTREALKGCVAGIVQLLLQAGMTPPDAHLLVAKALGKLAVRPERGAGNITDTTVRHWCDEVAADVGRRGTAAMVYDTMFTAKEIERLSAEPSNEARHNFALVSLCAFVEQIFPKCGA
jgi:hypothetical protein